MGIVSSPPKSGPGAPCHARERGVRASIRIRLDEWLESLRVSLKHEASCKFAAPARVVNNRSPARVEYSCLFVKNDRGSGDYVL